jgi:hypothetical protein
LKACVKAYDERWIYLLEMDWLCYFFIYVVGEYLVRLHGFRALIESAFGKGEAATFAAFLHVLASL